MSLTPFQTETFLVPNLINNDSGSRKCCYSQGSCDLLLELSGKALPPEHFFQGKLQLRPAKTGDRLLSIDDMNLPRGLPGNWRGEKRIILGDGAREAAIHLTATIAG
jgi:hypothetical protein